jgi:gamma-polyglutamate biosynthesis protein CapA
MKKAFYTLFLIFLTVVGITLFLSSNSIVTFEQQSNMGSNRTQPKEELTVLFLGDMMFDRAVRKTVETKGFDFVFGDSQKIFEGSDLIIGNLEGPITTYASKTLLADGTQTKSFTFTFPTSTATALKKIGIGIVNLANNHTDNFGREGINQTKKFLNDAGVIYFGDPRNEGEIATTTCKNNICLGLIGFHEFSFINQENIIKKIQELKPQVDHIVILPHWGDEYVTTFVPRQQKMARQWIDEGADLIIGTHPHVVESIETYKGKTIFYSLGNFIFDQYFSFETTHGILAKINFTKENYLYDIVPIQNTGITVKIPNASTTEKILRGIQKF